jgi:hypothetical protein
MNLGRATSIGHPHTNGCDRHHAMLPVALGAEHREEDGMKDAQCLYVVRWWVEPRAEAKVLAWMSGGHMAEVADHAGAHWARCVKLDQKDEKGWQAYQNIYGVPSRAELEPYFQHPVTAKIAAEIKVFGDVIRIQRGIGAVQYGLVL